MNKTKDSSARSTGTLKRAASLLTEQTQPKIIDRIDEQWIMSRQNKYKSFSVKSFIENFANEIFQHYHGTFNVFAIQDDDTEADIRIQFIPEPIQTVRTSISGKKFVVYIFRAGFVHLSELASKLCWQALGEHFRIADSENNVQIDFLFYL